MVRVRTQHSLNCHKDVHTHIYLEKVIFHLGNDDGCPYELLGL